MQCWLGTSISRCLLYCIVHHLHLPLGGPSWCDSYWLFPADSWMGHTCQKMLFLVRGWELVCTCGLESNKLCIILASGLWHLWGMSKDKLLGCIWCGGSGSSYLTNCWLQLPVSSIKVRISCQQMMLSWGCWVGNSAAASLEYWVYISIGSRFWQLHPCCGCLNFKLHLKSICV